MAWRGCFCTNLAEPCSLSRTRFMIVLMRPRQSGTRTCSSALSQSVLWSDAVVVEGISAKLKATGVGNDTLLLNAAALP